MSGGFDEIELEKALNKMSSKQVSILAYKGLQHHIIACKLSSDRVLGVFKWIGGILTVLITTLVLEKAGEILKVPHLPGVIN